MHFSDIPTSYVESNLKNALRLQTNDLYQITNITEKPRSLHTDFSKSSLNDEPLFMIYMSQSQPKTNENEKKINKYIWNIPVASKIKTIWWFFTWPIKLILTLTIPNPKTNRSWYPLTFLLCIIWIGLNSYMIVWMMSVIGT